MKYALFVNGQLSTRPNLGDEWIVVAVDGGMRHVDRADVVVGDLDSIESVPDCEVVKYPREKDETDLELALAWVKDQGGKIVRIYGALGGRVDHEMANIFLMGDERWKELDLVMLDGTTEVRVLHPGEFRFFRKKGDLLSLLPLEEIHSIKTKGLKYPLESETLRTCEIRGISNIFKQDEAVISHASGRIIAIAQEA